MGDLVEVLHSGEVSLEVVCSVPPTPAQYDEIYRLEFEDISKRCPNMSAEERSIYAGDKWDYSADSYVTLNSDEGYMPNHSHPSAVQLFPVRRKVSDKLRKMLMAGLEKAQRGE